METQQLVDLGKQMNLEGKELLRFVVAELALAREKRALIREEARAEKERIRQHKKEDAVRM